MKCSKLFNIIVVVVFLAAVVMAAIVDGIEKAKEAGILCEQESNLK